MSVAAVRVGGVTTHTRVSGDMAKPSMYNCLTLIKGGGGLGVAEGEGTDHRGPRALPQNLLWGLELLEVVGLQVREPPMFPDRFSAPPAAGGGDTRDRRSAHETFIPAPSKQTASPTCLLLF